MAYIGAKFKGQKRQKDFQELNIHYYSTWKIQKLDRIGTPEVR